MMIVLIHMIVFAYIFFDKLWKVAVELELFEPSLQFLAGVQQLQREEVISSTREREVKYRGERVPERFLYISP
jgi:hypothetical protein